MNYSTLIATVAVVLIPFGASAQEWTPKQAPLMTRFAKDIAPDNVLPEYPRPQMVRKKWLNLNGLWEFQPGTGENESYPEGTLERTILVPFAVESALSGVMEHHDRLWYRRTFTIPEDWKNQRVLLNFGAVDYECEVFINDESIGKHQGGYDPFSFDITEAINPEGKQSITVKVFDPTNDGGFPRGKQNDVNKRIMYTSVSGIWQTVWLEPVSQTRIDHFKLTPDIDQSVLNLTVFADGKNEASCEYTAEVLDGTTVVARIKGKPSVEMAIPIKDQKLWSPDSPFLYDLKITLTENGKPSDQISSYFGMRKISVETQGEFKRLCLNNEFVFQMGPLDQGYWPDGLYTAPTDEALKYDLEMTKALGFNMTRKHIKVEPYRWYYWADKLGLLVWQDMPSPNSYTKPAPPVDEKAFRSELIRMIETHWNHPSIIMWVVFNETQAAHNEEELCALVKDLDPTRLVNQDSGSAGNGKWGDITDRHRYPAPAAVKKPMMASTVGEYGGIGFIVPGHVWKEGGTYIMLEDEEEYMITYDDFSTMLLRFKTTAGLNAAVYTEITDVEAELNGLLTYDRVPKGDVTRFYASNRKAIDKTLSYADLLPTSEQTPQKWQYTTETPDASWMNPDFNDSSWKSGMGGFGKIIFYGDLVKTKWDTSDIWLRQEFTLGSLAQVNVDDLVLKVNNDDSCEVYINGVLATKLERESSGYIAADISETAKKALKSNAKNIIAIHCHQEKFGQYIDCGLSLEMEDAPIADEILEKTKMN